MFPFTLSISGFLTEYLVLTAIVRKCKVFFCAFARKDDKELGKTRFVFYVLQQLVMRLVISSMYYKSFDSVSKHSVLTQLEVPSISTAIPACLLLGWSTVVALVSPQLVNSPQLQHTICTTYL